MCHKCNSTKKIKGCAPRSQSAGEWLGETKRNRNTPLAVRNDIVSGQHISEREYKALPNSLKRDYNRKVISRETKSTWGSWGDSNVGTVAGIGSVASVGNLGGSKQMVNCEPYGLIEHDGSSTPCANYHEAHKNK